MTEAAINSAREHSSLDMEIANRYFAQARALRQGPVFMSEDFFDLLSCAGQSYSAAYRHHPVLETEQLAISSIKMKLKKIAGELFVESTDCTVEKAAFEADAMRQMVSATCQSLTEKDGGGLSSHRRRESSLWCFTYLLPAFLGCSEEEMPEDLSNFKNDPMLKEISQLVTIPDSLPASSDKNAVLENLPVLGFFLTDGELERPLMKKLSQLRSFPTLFPKEIQNYYLQEQRRRDLRMSQASFALVS